MALRALTMLLFVVAGCRGAGDEYDDYLARRGPAADDSGDVQSTLQDLSGRFLLHALLAGGLDLGLRAELTMDISATPIPLHARLWLATANPDADAPIVETDSVVAADGTFLLDAEPLVLAAGSTPGLNTDVRANVVLHAATQSPTAFCGTEFTIAELRAVYETVWGEPLHAGNFHRKVLSVPGFVESTNTTTERGGARGGPRAKLYRAGDARLLHPALLMPSREEAVR